VTDGQTDRHRVSAALMHSIARQIQKGVFFVNITRDAMHNRGLYRHAVSVCLSVRPSGCLSRSWQVKYRRSSAYIPTTTFLPTHRLMYTRTSANSCSGSFVRRISTDDSIRNEPVRRNSNSLREVMNTEFGKRRTHV